MIFAKIKEEEQENFEKEIKETKDAKWYRRLKIIQLSSQGRAVPQLAKDFEISKGTVRNYIHRYNQGGIKGLRANHIPGKPAKIRLSKEQWEEVLHTSPGQFGELNTAAMNWNQDILVEYCCKYLGVDVVQSTISVIFKRIGINWKRAKLKVTSPDPLYTLKRDRQDTLKKSPMWTPNQL